jgi:FixJ family two-component response regulator
MALATVSSQVTSHFLDRLFPGTGAEGFAPVTAGEALAVSEPCAVVHLVHADETAAQEMARCWGWLGARTRIHPDAAAFMRAGPCEAPGCVVVHVRLAEMDGVEPQVDYSVPETRLPMIVTTERTDVRTAVLAMKAGAVDFFQTPLSDRDLGEAIESAIRSDRARCEVEMRRAAVEARFATLTPREREVMGLVTQGLLNKQVAGGLGLSEITVKVHRGSAMRKMGARTIADLIRMADTLAL